jgi:PIN domain nuclease of toxin-antitoxin system
MNRYLLDTNIMLFILFQPDELDNRVRRILNDYNNLFYVSLISLQEIVLLYKKGKLKSRWKKSQDIFPSIEAMNVQFLPVKKEHLATYLNLNTADNHNDPNDHIIISQAITEGITLVSSDRQFEFYTRQRLDFIFNER